METGLSRRAFVLLLSAPMALACVRSERALPVCELPDAGENASSLNVAAPTDPVLLAAGDIADCDDNAAERTARLLDRLDGTIAALGDNAYESGTLDEYMECYDPTWGRHRNRTRPTVGNHEYRTPGAGPYFAYFCGLAGEPFKGWYSYELGSWHVVVLNSNCSQLADGCAAGSEQHRWLRDDLATHRTKCTLAYWHHPIFSSGQHGNNGSMGAMYRELYDAGAEIVLAGHEHDYERFAPLTPFGERDDARGIREFVVGTGGRAARAFGAPKPHSEARHTGLYGVLSLTLHDSSYDWQFIRDDGGAADSGHGECH